MNADLFLKEVEKRLTNMFSASKEGYKISVVERHRLEGFMQAGVFMKLTDNSELSKLMDSVHFAIFGKNLQQRQSESSFQWTETTVDYTQYEQPSYERRTTGKD